MSQGLCPSCGAVANLTAEQNEANCTYCGSVVTRTEAEAQLNTLKSSKFAGTLMIAETAQEGGSYEEALNYYNKVIEQEPSFGDAWLNKGICMVNTSKIGNLKIPEAISSWKAAIKFAKNPEAMKKRVALEINNVVAGFYPRLQRHYLEFHNTSNALSEHFDRFILLESALSLALEWNPKSAVIAKNGIDLCDEFVKSIKAAADDDFGDAVSSALNKNWDAAFENAALGAGNQNLATNIEKSLLKIKLKYLGALQENKGTGGSAPVEELQSKIKELTSEAEKHEKEEKHKRSKEWVEKEAEKTFLGKITKFGCLGQIVYLVLLIIVLNVVLKVFPKDFTDEHGVLTAMLCFVSVAVFHFYLRNTIRKQILAKRNEQLPQPSTEKLK